MNPIPFFTRPNTCSIFSSDPATLGTVLPIVLQNVVFPDPRRVRLDLLHNATGTSRYSPARSPLEEATADDIKKAPRTWSVQGSISATPIGPLATQLGAFGSAVRRDLRELDKLRKLADKEEPVVLVLPSEIASSVAITSVVDTHTGPNKVEVVLTFAEMRIVSPFTIAADLDLDELLAGSGAAENAGAQPVEAVDIDVGEGLG